LSTAQWQLDARAAFRSAAITRRAGYSAILFLLCLAFFQAHASKTLLDPDTYWHIIVGRNIWRTGKFPYFDHFSYTLAGAPWIAKEWLSQLAFYGAYSLGGWFAVALLTNVIASASYVVLFYWLQGRVKPIVALTMTLVGVSLAQGSMLARPQIFYYLLLSLLVCGLVSAVEKKKTPWWLIPMTALWANMHPSFPIALVLAGLFAIEAVMTAPREARLRTLFNWAVAILGAAAVTGATPYGYEPFLVAFKIAGGKAPHYINEWQPARVNLPGVYGAAFLIGSLAIVLASRVSRARLLPLLACGGLMMRHVRFFSLFGIVGSAALAGPVAERFPRFAADPEHSPGAAERKWTSAALAMTSLVAIGVLAFWSHPNPAANITPSTALEAAEKYGVSGPVFNDYQFGGYLIFRGIKTFIDGRAELYIDNLFPILHAGEQGSDRKAFLSLLRKYNVTWALVADKSRGADKLERSGQWNKIYKDDVADVFVRTMP
jgi:hypothetical protein